MTIAFPLFKARCNVPLRLVWLLAVALSLLKWKQENPPEIKLPLGPSDRLVIFPTLFKGVELSNSKESW